jgi:hypothetical protein
MDMFRGLTSSPAPQMPQNPNMPTPPGNIQEQAALQGNAPATPGTAPNGMIPANIAEIKKQSPLDQFNDIWKNPETPLPGDVGQPFYNLDNAKLQAVAASQNFVSNIPKEKFAAVAQGGEAAIGAMMEIMNAMGQQVYMQSAIASTRIAENGLTRAQDRFQTQLPHLITKHTLSDTLRQENPAFAHPAAQPVVNAIQQQMAVKHPNATAAELRDMTLQYLTNFAGLVAPSPSATGTKNGKSADEDWSNFLM